MVVKKLIPFVRLCQNNPILQVSNSERIQARKRNGPHENALKLLRILVEILRRLIQDSIRSHKRVSHRSNDAIAQRDKVFIPSHRVQIRETRQDDSLNTENAN